MIGGYERRITGQAIKVYHNGIKRTLVAYITNSLWYSNYRVCGDFALEILSSLPPLDTNKKSMGGGGDFPSEIITIIYKEKNVIINI
jgi:hypothetical protein